MLYVFDTIKINVEGNAARKFVSDSDYKHLKIMRQNCFSLESKVAILKLFFCFRYIIMLLIMVRLYSEWINNVKAETNKKVKLTYECFHAFTHVSIY